MSAQEAKQQQQFKQILERLLQEPENKACADCNASAPRWASSKLGVFLCIKCAGIHRSMGTHISFVRSVNLDKWKDTEIQTMQEFGNRRAAMLWEATLPEGFRRPSANDGYNLEKFIRAKYEKKQFFQHKSREELNSAPSRQVYEPAQVISPPPLDDTKRLSSPARRPIRRPPGHTFTPPNSPPPQSPPANDFGPFERSPPPVNLLSTAVNLLSMEADASDFGSYTPPAAPRAEPATVAHSPPHPIAQPTSPSVNPQAAKDSIMGLFEPTQPAFNPYGYQSPPQVYPTPISPQMYHQGYAYPQAYGSPTTAYYQTGYAQPISPTQSQWGYPGADPLLHQIQSISQPKPGVQGTGLSTLLL